MFSHTLIVFLLLFSREEIQYIFWSPFTRASKLDLGLVDIERLRNFLDKSFFKLDRIFLVLIELFVRIIMNLEATIIQIN